MPRCRALSKEAKGYEKTLTPAVKEKRARTVCTFYGFGRHPHRDGYESRRCFFDQGRHRFDVAGKGVRAELVYGYVEWGEACSGLGAMVESRGGDSAFQHQGRQRLRYFTTSGMGRGCGAKYSLTYSTCVSLSFTLCCYSRLYTMIRLPIVNPRSFTSYRSLCNKSVTLRAQNGRLTVDGQPFTRRAGGLTKQHHGMPQEQQVTPQKTIKTSRETTPST